VGVSETEAVGVADGELLGEDDGSPHSTPIGSHGSSTRYAQNSNSPPNSVKSSTLQASHSSGSKSSSM